ncbi:MAG: CPBP family intramembrane metalloprotease [Anaerolineaceae bacterium]|nr:CPBP family intramembrane metalloprotease [Anaerolineaceae bacterium]
MFRQLVNRIAANEPTPPWGVWGAIGAMIASFVAIILGSAISIILLPQSQYTYLLGWSIGALLVFVFVWIRRRSPHYWSAMWNGTPASRGQSIFWYLLIGVGLAILLDLVGRSVVGLLIPDPELLDLYAAVQLRQPIAPLSWIFVVLFMVILQPLAEGLVFQGLLLPSLRATISPWGGFILSAAAYTMFHFVSFPVPASANNNALIWIGLVQPLIGGLIFAAVRVYTGSTRAAVLTHMAFGLFAVVKLLTLVSS